MDRFHPRWQAGDFLCRSGRPNCAALGRRHRPANLLLRTVRPGLSLRGPSARRPTLPDLGKGRPGLVVGVEKLREPLNRPAEGMTTMVLIHSKSMRLLLLATSVLAIGSGLLAQNQADGARAEGPKPVPAKRVKTDLYGDPLPQGAVTRLGTLRYRAPAEIVSLAYAPDGKTIAACSYAGLFLFDAASGKRLRRLDPDSAQVLNNTAVFSPDSKRLAIRGRAIVGDPKGKHRLRVWDFTGEGKPKEYDAEHLTWFGWSADNEPLAVCVEKAGLRLQELGAGKSRFFACQELRRPE